VDLVRAGVVEVFALEVDLRTAQLARQPLGEIERRGPPGIVRTQVVEFGDEGRVGLGFAIGAFEVENERHQRLGDEASAELTKPAELVRAIPEAVGPQLVHATYS